MVNCEQLIFRCPLNAEERDDICCGLGSLQDHWSQRMTRAFIDGKSNFVRYQSYANLDFNEVSPSNLLRSVCDLRWQAVGFDIKRLLCFLKSRSEIVGSSPP